MWSLRESFGKRLAYRFILRYCSVFAVDVPPSREPSLDVDVYSYFGADVN